jgi:hypothetical protein
MARHKDLEIEQNLAFQRREWRAQSIGWWVLTAFLVAAMLGLFGEGPLSRARAGEAGDPMWIEYERFVRVGRLARLTVHTGARESSEPLELRIARSYFEGLILEHVVPEPDDLRVDADHVTMAFSGGRRPAAIVFDVQPRRAGLQRGEIAAGTTVRHTFTQFAYF